MYIFELWSTYFVCLVSCMSFSAAPKVFVLKPSSCLWAWDCFQNYWKCSEISLIIYKEPIKSSGYIAFFFFFFKWHRWIVLLMRCILLNLRWQTVCCIITPLSILARFECRQLIAFYFQGPTVFWFFIFFCDNCISQNTILLPFPWTPESRQLVQRSLRFTAVLWAQRSSGWRSCFKSCIDLNP